MVIAELTLGTNKWTVPTTIAKDVPELLEFRQNYMSMKHLSLLVESLKWLIQSKILP
jgi:hypothetical protein